mgnify:CR=1 FL=1
MTEQKIRRDRNMGDNLRRLRDQSGLSQEKLCAELQRRAATLQEAPMQSTRLVN